MKTYALNNDGVLKHYDYLWRLTPDRWAWEYLRRNPDFLADAKTWSADQIAEGRGCRDRIRLIRSRVPQSLAARWGLALMPDPDLNGIDADAIWQADVFPDQFEVHVGPRAAEESCEIFERTVPVCDISHFTDAFGREFLLLRGKGCVVQVRCTGLSLLSLEPVRMKLQVSDVDAYERQLKAYKDTLVLYGPEPDAQDPLWTKRTQMLRDGLVALDCLALGCSRKETARVLYGAATVDQAWSSGTSNMKDSLRYLLKKAGALRDGGYLTELLGADPETEIAAA